MRQTPCFHKVGITQFWQPTPEPLPPPSLHRPPHGAHGTNQGAIATHANLRTDGGTSNTQSRSENVVLLAAHCRLAFNWAANPRKAQDADSARQVPGPEHHPPCANVCSRHRLRRRGDSHRGPRGGIAPLGRRSRLAPPRRTGSIAASTNLRACHAGCRWHPHESTPA